jgi:hypothetical protein
MGEEWDRIGEILDWLDTSSTLPPEQERLLRIMKITEEAGEVSQAVTGSSARTRAGASPTPGTT